MKTEFHMLNDLQKLFIQARVAAVLTKRDTATEHYEEAARFYKVCREAMTADEWDECITVLYTNRLFLENC